MATLNHTLAVNTNPTTSSIPVLYQPTNWDPAAVYGIVFGVLAVLLAVPGAYLAILGLRRHRASETRQYVMDALEAGTAVETRSVVLNGELGVPGGINEGVLDQSRITYTRTELDGSAR